MQITEINSRAAMIRSRVPGQEYAVNPYSGCGHACVYCYMRVIGRDRTARRGAWGSWVDARVNTPSLLLKELRRRPRGRVMLSSACDCYQPVEKKYGLTRACLELLGQVRFPVSILTKNALVLRDLDLLRTIDDLRVGVTITTDDDQVRRALEPGASSIEKRLDALKELHRAGLKPHVFVGPALPMDPLALARAIEPYASRALFDRMNYPSLSRAALSRPGWSRSLDPTWFEEVVEVFRKVMGHERVEAVC